MSAAVDQRIFGSAAGASLCVHAAADDGAVLMGCGGVLRGLALSFFVERGEGAGLEARGLAVARALFCLTLGDAGGDLGSVSGSTPGGMLFACGELFRCRVSAHARRVAVTLSDGTRL
tara:strand:- start:1 stop:354 length:354 start_codon:yes stop_codon:yes gene_type:complete